jgi:serine/threonine-protein kinase
VTGQHSSDSAARSGLLGRLRERGVLRVAASYAVIAWLALQIASVVFDPLGVPKWVLTALIIAAAIGFPIAIALAWFLEIGAHGVHFDTAAEGAPRPTARGLRHYTDAIVIGGLLITVVILTVRQSDLGKPKPPENPAIAVLPFVNETGDPDQEYFSDGLADEMLDRLGRVPGLRVIARSSSFSFKGKDVDVKTVAEMLGVTTVLEGSVRRKGKRLRLSARLIDGATGQQAWSGSFDREVSDVFDVQAELARVVVDAIIPAARGTVGQSTPRPTSDMNAYDLYLIGKQGQWQRSRESVQRAVSALQQSVELDPKYAPAHAQLSLALLTAVGYAGMNPKEALPRSEAAAHRALALDPNLPEAHVALAESLAFKSGPGESVLAELHRALELNPNSSIAMFQYGNALKASGLSAESRQWEKRVLQIDPLAVTPRANLIIDLHNRGDDRARDHEIERFKELFNSDADGMTALARVCLRFLDDPLCAARAARRAIQLEPPEPTPWATVYLHRALLAVGAYDEAAELQARTDWKRVSPDTWAYESALAAGSRPDLAALASAIESIRSLAPDPARAKALVYWLTLAGQPQEAAKLVDEASASGPLHTYSLTGLEAWHCDIAALWSLRVAEPPAAFRRDFEDVLRDERKSLAIEPLNVQALLDLAALHSMNGDDPTAMAMLQRAFRRSALPAGFMPHLPWFARLAGRPEFDRLVKDWQTARAAARSRMVAPQNVPAEIKSP